MKTEKVEVVKFKVEQATWVLGVEYRKDVDVWSSDKKTVDALRGCPHTKEIIEEKKEK